MANNRMTLMCPCGEGICLAKYYPSSGWYFYRRGLDSDERLEELDTWLETHSGHGGAILPEGFGEHTMWGPVHFTFEYEHLPGDA